tara:strand:+ start:2773 stop:5160 length:2388 start_codon:yes stop_codon:yes gene_type:complete
MGLMSQKDLAQQGAGRIHEFLQEEDETSVVQEEAALSDEFAAEGDYLDSLKDKQLVQGPNGQEWSDLPFLDKGLTDPLADIAELTPVVGDIMAAGNALSSAVQGDWEDAAWGALASVPLLGKPIKKALKPKKTVKAYKLFRTDPNKPGELFPLFVNAKQSVKQGEWIDAEIGPMKDGKVKSKIGNLAMRPGWHGGDLPVATHIGGKTSKDLTGPNYRPDNQVWAEVEMPDDVDWQTEAIKRADRNKKGDVVPRTAHITDQLPTGGHYRYKTNPNMTGEWLIGGAMKVNKVLSDADVTKINNKAGVTDLPRLGTTKLAKRTEIAGNKLDTKLNINNQVKFLEDHGYIQYSGKGDKAGTFDFKNDKMEVYSGYTQDSGLGDGHFTRGVTTNTIDKNNSLKSLRKIVGYNEGGLVDEVDNINDYTLDGGLPKVAAPDEGDRAALDAAVREMRRIEADGPTPTFYDRDDQDFAEYGGTEEPVVATPSTAITQTEEMLTGASVQSEGLLDETGMSNREPMVPIDETGMSNRESASENPVNPKLVGWSNLAGLESDTLHVDPIGIVTMGYGVVPDGGVTLDGKDINVKKDHGLTSTSDLSGLDTSKAYKTVNGVKYKRADYTSDALFSKAIYTGFYSSAKANVDNFAILTDEQKEVIIDLGYNAGEGAFTVWNDTDTLANELVKDVDERTITNLTQFTDNFAASGKFGGGVLRRRALSANKVLGEDDQIAYIEQGDDISGTTKFTLKRSDGTTVREWDRETSKVNAYPAGKPILTIDGERKASYAPRQAKVDLTDWARAIV